MMRDRAGQQRVTNVELFFDLVFVFAVTQLSHFLLSGPGSHSGAYHGGAYHGGAYHGGAYHGGTDHGRAYHGHAYTALLAALLLTMVWLLWSYTTWVTNWLDPELIAVRLLLLVLAMISLFSSAALPTAFERSGLIVGAAYLVIQVGRSAFTVVVIGDPVLRRNFQRILAWCVVSGLLALAGGLVHGDLRVLLWACAVAVDLLGGAAGFYTPGLGRSRTADWTIEGGHFAERCQGFILIAIGESLVVIGASLAVRLDSSHPLTGAEIAAFLIAVVGSVAFWWVYFDRAAEDAADIIARSADPGRLGRSAYHLIHPDHGGRDHRRRGRRRGGRRRGCGARLDRARVSMDSVADPRRARLVPGWPRGLQGGDLAADLLAAARCDRGARLVRAARAPRSRARPGRLRHRRRPRGRGRGPHLAARACRGRRGRRLPSRYVFMSPDGNRRG